MKSQADPIWSQLISGARNPELNSLATRLTLTRLRQAHQNKTMTMAQATGELHRFASENEFARRDLQLT